MRFLLLVLFTAVATHAGEPCMFRTNPSHSGIMQDAKHAGLGGLKWKFHTGAAIFSSPAVCDGTVFIGSIDHNLYSLEAATGRLNWRFVTEGPVRSSPAVDEKRVYVLSQDGKFYALDRATGKPAWTFSTGGERRFTAPGIHGMGPRKEMMPDPFDVFASSPVLADGMVFFGSGDGAIYALAAETGSLRWKYQTGNVVHTAPAAVDGVVYVGSFDRYLYALDEKTGAVRWKFETGDDQTIYNQVGIASSPAVVDGTVYFGSRDSHLYALDAVTGKKKWAYDNHGGWVIASPVVYEGTVLFPTSDGQLFLCVDAGTGELRYKVVNRAISFSSPAVVGGVVFYGTSDGWLHALDARTGASRGDFQTDGNKQNGAKYLDAEGNMKQRAIYSDFTLDATIAGLDRMYSLGSVLSSPVVANGVVFFGSTDGNVYAVE
jgi:eukaryotic-like serine/threonine-protein kinase